MNEVGRKELINFFQVIYEICSVFIIEVITQRKVCCSFSFSARTKRIEHIPKIVPKFTFVQVTAVSHISSAT